MLVRPLALALAALAASALCAAPAAASAQPVADDDFEVFSEEPGGWSVVRRPDGCFTASSFDGPGAPSFTIFYSTRQADSPLALIFANADWRLPTEEVDDYRLDFPGSGHQWTELRGTSLAGEGGDSSLIGISFAADAVDAMLSDLASAGAAELFRGGAALQGYRLTGNAAAVRGLIACLRSFPGATLPPLPRAEAATAGR